MLKKSALGVGLFEPETAIECLEIKSLVGKKMSKDDLTSVLNMHEDDSEDDSELPIRVRRKKVKFKNWKVWWIEEIEDKAKIIIIIK